MIVKNEERNLKRCLESLKGLMDEIIIVDTGSTDATKEIASAYTDKIYDFEWINDFSKARNFAFSKATMEYIYSADADEVLDEVNRERFRILKMVCDPQIEIVQMYYANQLENNAIYNYDKEYRPKLFKRIRNFCWIEPIHEMVRIEPLVFESDIEIIHKPHGVHAERDLGYFEEILDRGDNISERLWGLYARELYIAGSNENLKKARPHFEKRLKKGDINEDAANDARCVLMKSYRLLGEDIALLTLGIEGMAAGAVSEVCMELGQFYKDRGDMDEAVIWFYNAAYETESALDIHSCGDIPRLALAECAEISGDINMKEFYEKDAGEWISRWKQGQ